MGHVTCRTCKPHFCVIAILLMSMPVDGMQTTKQKFLPKKSMVMHDNVDDHNSL